VGGLGSINPDLNPSETPSLSEGCTWVVEVEQSWPELEGVSSWPPGLAVASREAARA
jgi:hypothetical protein